MSPPSMHAWIVVSFTHSKKAWSGTRLFFRHSTLSYRPEQLESGTRSIAKQLTYTPVSCTLRSIQTHYATSTSWKHVKINTSDTPTQRTVHCIMYMLYFSLQIAILVLLCFGGANSTFSGKGKGKGKGCVKFLRIYPLYHVNNLRHNVFVLFIFICFIYLIDDMLLNICLWAITI